MKASQTMQVKRDPRVVDAIVSTVADILTLTEKEARARIKPAPTVEIEALHLVFSSGVQQSGKQARKWRGHTLSRLPISQWVNKDGFFSVLSSKEATLKYLNTLPPEQENERALGQLDNRAVLCEALVETLPSHVQKEFRPMLEWAKIETYNDSHPLLNDIALAYGVYGVEHLFHAEYHKQEAELRSMKGIPANEATPHDWMSWLGQRARIFANANLAMWDVVPLREHGLENEEDQALLEDEETERLRVRGQLTLELLCGITANRYLLESARIGALSAQAAEINLPFLKALNRNGVVTIPELKTDKDIETTLSMWFGPEGCLASEPGFHKPLQGDTLEIVMHHAAQVHAHYLCTRASSIKHIHLGPQHKFIFALALVACRYGKIALDKEFPGDSNSSYAPFPSQNKGLQDRLEPLESHARELIKSLYGQIYYANTGWDIRADHVEAYVENMSFKRSCMQELVFKTFKRLPPARLLRLCKTLNDMADRQEKVFGQTAPGTPRPATRLEYVFAGVDALDR